MGLARVGCDKRSCLRSVDGARSGWRSLVTETPQAASRASLFTELFCRSPNSSSTKYGSEDFPSCRQEDTTKGCASPTPPPRARMTNAIHFAVSVPHATCRRSHARPHPLLAHAPTGHRGEVLHPQQLHDDLTLRLLADPALEEGDDGVVQRLLPERRDVSVRTHASTRWWVDALGSCWMARERRSTDCVL